MILEETNTNQIDEIYFDNHITEINYHYVTEIHRLAFKGLTNIIQIDLSDNMLVNISQDIFNFHIIN